MLGSPGANHRRQSPCSYCAPCYRSHFVFYFIHHDVLPSYSVLCRPLVCFPMTPSKGRAKNPPHRQVVIRSFPGSCPRIRGGRDRYDMHSCPYLRETTPPHCPVPASSHRKKRTPQRNCIRHITSSSHARTTTRTHGSPGWSVKPS